MKELLLPSAANPILDWLIFGGFMLLVCLCVGGLIVWMKVSHANKSKRKHRKHRHHRPINPTLAETGGLPPMRDPDRPPHGL